jgi:hypothetical protein
LAITKERRRQMEYRIEPIGSEFSNKAVSQLGDRFTAQAQTGWKLHSVFQAQQPGCLGIGSPTITYFAIYVKE